MRRRYCEAVKNVTVAVPDEVYRQARIRAAERGTSISALVSEYLQEMSDDAGEFRRLETRQRRIQGRIGSFRAADRLQRSEIHDRQVR